MTKVSSYLEYRQYLKNSNCQKCSLGTHRTHIVVDRGNENAKIIIVGEAPGADEDKIGRPFVGRSGRLMDKLFLEVGIDTNKDALVANIAKCRPPKNRQPTKAEAHTCLPYLIEQIKRVGPNWVILMGRTAATYLLPDTSKSPMSEIVGKVYKRIDFDGIGLIPLYHPAYVLRDPRKKPMMIDLLKTIVCIIK